MPTLQEAGIDIETPLRWIQIALCSPFLHSVRLLVGHARATARTRRRKTRHTRLRTIPRQDVFLANETEYEEEEEAEEEEEIEWGMVDRMRTLEARRDDAAPLRDGRVLGRQGAQLDQYAPIYPPFILSLIYALQMTRTTRSGSPRFTS